jgi:hypothetical protein
MTLTRKGIFKGDLSLFVPPNRDKSGYIAMKSDDDVELFSDLDDDLSNFLELKVKTVLS